jgi:HK97 family phage portal protein
MHWMHLMTSDGLDWKSPIQLCRESVGLAMATEEHAARLFGNGTRPSGFLKMPGHFKDDIVKKNFSKSWHEANAGLRNTGKTVILEDGLEWQSVGMTSEDAQFIELRSFQLAEIGPRIFGVPSHKLGDLSRSTNNNIEHQGIEFVTDTIRPGVVRWEQSMQRDLIFGKRTHCVNFDMDGLMRGDSAATAAKNSSDLQNGVKNRNEVRRKDGLNPVDDASMNAYTVQSNMIDVKDMGKFMNPKQTELPK